MKNTTDNQRVKHLTFCTAVIQSNVEHGIRGPARGKQGGEQLHCDVKVLIRLQARKLAERN